MNTTVLERFLKYIKVDTMSQPEQESTPARKSRKTWPIFWHRN